MNRIVDTLQEWYRKEREKSNYSIMDIDNNLIQLAEKGIIWTLKSMTDVTEIEEIAIKVYMSKYQSQQIYDNLEQIPFLKTLDNKFQLETSKDTAPETPSENKIFNYLPIRNIELFTGYLKAKELEEKIIKATCKFPTYERYHIVDQILRSSSSIKESIAKGEQKYIKEKFNQYSIAIGSAKETSAWLQISFKLGYLTEKEFKKLDRLTIEVIARLTKSLSNLREKNEDSINLPNPYTPDIKKFIAYQKSLTIVGDIYHVTKKKEMWGDIHLVNQLRKSATSCAANIAEANQLYITKKFKFFNQAIQALDGLASYLETAQIQGMITKEEIKCVEDNMDGIKKILLTQLGNFSKSKAV